MLSRRVFVDCGSNLGKVLEDRIKLGLEDEFFAFEPQPELGHVAGEVQTRHPGVKVNFMPKAVWVREEKVEFFLATRWGPNHRGGSTLVQGHTKNGSAVDYERPVSVQGIDFSQWVLDNFSADDHIVVKMDIEGAEYPVLEKMCKDGSIAYVDELIVEFHHHMNETVSKERHESLLTSLHGKTRIVRMALSSKLRD